MYHANHMLYALGTVSARGTYQVSCAALLDAMVRSACNKSLLIDLNSERSIRPTICPAPEPEVHGSSGCRHLTNRQGQCPIVSGHSCEAQL